MSSKNEITGMQQFLEEIFPQITGKIEILTINPAPVSVKLIVGHDDLRPGGTISGPSIFLLADVAFYVAVLSEVGKQVLAVTTNGTINFLRKPAPRNLIAEAEILKKGKNLIFGEVKVKSEYGSDLVAHATMTYSIPQNKKTGGDN